MLSFSKTDLANGAQEKVVAASDFKGPRPRAHRNMTDLFCVPLILLGLIFSGYCAVAPHVTGDPGYYKVTYGTAYDGEPCSGTKKKLYPIHRSGVGACTETCPNSETADNVNGHNPDHKDRMVCMSSEDFADPKYTDVAAAGKTMNTLSHI